MKTFFKSSAGMLAFLIVVLAFSTTVWMGCNDRAETPVAPASSQQVAAFDKANPQVQAIMSVQARHTDALMSNPDVVGTGIGLGEDGKPVLLILTKREGVKGLPTAVEGVKTRIDVVGEVRAMAFTGKYRPVPAGVSVGNTNECAAGTIGCQLTIGGSRFALSNNHVFARENAATIGEGIVQPGRYDTKPRCAQSESVATLSDFEPIVFSTSADNVMDAAIARYADNVSTMCSMVNNLYTPSSTVVAPSLGLAVKKVGRTSELTTGTISGINVTLNVGYSAGTARFVNQIYVKGSFIRSGDSGSLMVTQNGNNPVGLNFAGGGGGSFANPIGPVLVRFNATVCAN